MVDFALVDAPGGHQALNFAPLAVVCGPRRPLTPAAVAAWTLAHLPTSTTTPAMTRQRQPGKHAA